jgi:hypothetical protein
MRVLRAAVTAPNITLSLALKSARHNPWGGVLWINSGQLLGITPQPVDLGREPSRRRNSIKTQSTRL